MAKIAKKYENEFLQPYTEEEFQLHDIDRDWKIHFETIHSQNMMLVRRAVRFLAYRNGTEETPPESLGALLAPGFDVSRNQMGGALALLRNLMLATDSAAVPCPTIVTFASRSFMTLIQQLKSILSSRHLLEMERTGRRVYRYLAGFDEPPADPVRHQEEIKELFASFEKSAHLYSGELCAFEAEFCHRKQENTQAEKAPCAVRRRRVQHFTDAQREYVLFVWKRAQDDGRVLKYCVRSRPTKAAAFLVYVRELKRIDICDVETFCKCLKSAVNRRNYRAGQSIQDC